ncbi:MAG: PEP-CTERM sorting domain-containing protein [Deferrisomatales bacterium]|nr:PEP-CTERM sorting domain-containing protein [Deferrisomatales bacterium]
MKRLGILLTCCFAPFFFCSSAWALAADILVPIDVNKYWNAVDEETDDTDTTDSLMCWAATSANVLEATGWLTDGHVDNYDAYHEYLVNFSNGTGSGTLGYSSYFDEHYYDTGTDTYEYNYMDYFAQIHYDTTNPDSFLENMDWLLHENGAIEDPYEDIWGIYLSITNNAAGHAITVWDYAETDTDGDGDIDKRTVTVTDSDDAGVNFDTYEAHDYDLVFNDDTDRWYLDGYGAGNWYVRRMDALAPKPTPLIFILPEYLTPIAKWELKYPVFADRPIALTTWTSPQVTAHYLSQNLSLVPDGPNSPFAPVPEPGTMLLLGSGLLGLAGYGRKRRKA